MTRQALAQQTSPPHAAPGADDRQTLARWALWDFVEGVRLWEMWLRQSWNEVRRRYKRTVIGPMWVTISLLVFALVLSFVWAGLFNMKVTEFLPFFLSGMLPWTLIAGAIGESCTVFLTGEALMKSRQFPYTTLIYSVLARNTIIFGHNLIGYTLIAAYCGVAVGWQTLFLPIGLILVIANCAWMGVVVAIFCLRFRDFPQLVASFLQIAMFITPIFWNASQLQGKRAMLVTYNPLHHLVELVRQPLLGKLPAMSSVAISLSTAVVGIAVAYWLFARKRHRLAYWF